MKGLSLPIVLLLFFCLLQSTSCTRTITCSDGTIRLRTVGFNKADFNGAVAFKYKQGGTFSTVVDSTSMIFYNVYREDTADLAAYAVNRPDSMHPSFFVPKYDYRIVLPAIGRTFSITNIMQDGHTQESYSSGLFGDKLVMCFNTVVSASLDGNTVTAASTAQYFSLYLVK